MNKHDYKIEISANSGCHNEPYKIHITFQLDEPELKAIQMKYDINSWTYKDGCKIDFVKDKMFLTKGFKDRLNLSQKINSIVTIGLSFLTITNFEYNVAKELLKKK